ncbi:MAG TPA: hypothetical protein VJX74_12035 [Blastocatellia bacterium]|nr:hypothetical protein [Blastocatellia bacterium]
MLSHLQIGFLLALTVSLSGSKSPAQNQSAPSTDERAALMLRSPHLIEWFIDVNENVDLKQIWALLKIEISADMSYRCKGDCEAETFDIDPGKTVALRISYKDGNSHQYLFFKRTKSDSTDETWQFIGNIPAHGPPEYRIEKGDDRTWFLMKELRGREAYAEVWYEIKEKEVREVLSYPIQGQSVFCQNNLTRTYGTLLFRHDFENGIYTVPIQFILTYHITDCNKKEGARLFAKGQKAYFVWDDGKQRFILDKSRSEVTEEELGSVYNNERLSGEKLIEHNFAELSKIAKFGDSEQKRWLRIFLNSLKDSPQKLALQQALKEI